MIFIWEVFLEEVFFDLRFKEIGKGKKRVVF